MACFKSTLASVFCIWQLFALHPLGSDAAASRSCNNVFQCMPILIQIPFADITATASFYGKEGASMKLISVNESEWSRQMSTLGSLCRLWVDFDTCMGDSWIECIDWNQLSLMVEMVANSGGARAVSVNATAEAEQRARFLNKTQARMEQSGTTTKDMKTMIRMASMICQSAPRFLPQAGCVRNMIVGNETIFNATNWYTALLEQSKNNGSCVQSSFTCEKFAKVNHMVGHWLYHNCPGMSSEIDTLVRMIFQMWDFGDDSCKKIFEGKTAAELYEAPYDKRTEIDFGGNLAKCNLSAAVISRDKAWNGTLGNYLRGLNLTREEYFNAMACKIRNISLLNCNIWPLGKPASYRTTTRRPRTTTRTTTQVTTTTEIVNETPAPELVLVQPVAQRLTANDLPANGEEAKATTPSKRPVRGRTTRASAKANKDNESSNTVSTVRFEGLFIILCGVAIFLTSHM